MLDLEDCKYQFREVHVTEDPHDHRLLRLSRVCPLHRTKSPQHRQDVPQPEVIVNLSRENSMYNYVQYRSNKHSTKSIMYNIVALLLLA